MSQFVHKHTKYVIFDENRLTNAHNTANNVIDPA